MTMQTTECPNLRRRRMTRRDFIAGILAALALTACGRAGLVETAPREAEPLPPPGPVGGSLPRTDRVALPDEAWQARLSAEQYYVLRQSGTEMPYDNAYWDHHEQGAYVCAGCGLPLFSSETKYNSGTGWPSFWEPVAGDVVEATPDASLGLAREEVLCARCGGHLGHVFPDGPPPTGLRYCINSAALAFAPNGG